MSYLHDGSPDVSVIIPAHRAAGGIASALDSVFAQTFSRFEVIVITDASADASELQQALAPYTSRVRYLELPKRGGAAAARNAGILTARGRYLAFLDANDRWRPEFLERQVSYLEAHPLCTMVYADALIVGESPSAGRRFMEGASSIGPITLMSLVDQRCTVMLSTTVARRNAIVAVGMFDEELRRGQDFDLWLRLALRGAVLQYQPVVMAERRVRAATLSDDSVAELERALNVLERFARRHSLEAPIRTALRIRTMQLVDRLEIEQAKQRILEGHFAAAQYHLSAAGEQPLRVRLARLAIQVAPRLVRAVYTRARGVRNAPPVPCVFP